MKAQNRQHHNQTQVLKADRLHPIRKAGAAMQAEARHLPSAALSEAAPKQARIRTTLEPHTLLRGAEITRQKVPADGGWCIQADVLRYSMDAPARDILPINGGCNRG
jgi:hypothetical protein